MGEERRKSERERRGQGTEREKGKGQGQGNGQCFWPALKESREPVVANLLLVKILLIMMNNDTLLLVNAVSCNFIRIIRRTASNEIHDKCTRQRAKEWATARFQLGG